jgi:hypothetical protein
MCCRYDIWDLIERLWIDIDSRRHPTRRAEALDHYGIHRRLFFAP